VIRQQHADIENVLWSPTARVIYPSRGKVKLLDQHPELQKVVRGGIQEVIRTAISENAFPAMHSHTEFARSALIVGADKCRAHEIKKRLKSDIVFVRDLEELVYYTLS
jgi:hypothetical protein